MGRLYLNVNASVCLTYSFCNLQSISLFQTALLYYLNLSRWQLLPRIISMSAVNSDYFTIVSQTFWMSDSLIIFVLDFLTNICCHRLSVVIQTILLTHTNLTLGPQCPSLHLGQPGSGSHDLEQCSHWCGSADLVCWCGVYPEELGHLVQG